MSLAGHCPSPPSPRQPGDTHQRDTYGHTPVSQMFGAADVYGIGYDIGRAGRAPVRLAFIGAGGVAQSKWLPALLRLRTL